MRIKPTNRTIQFLFRRATQHFRSLPQFIVIGAQKAGTTSLQYYLSQHPHIVPGFRKGIHFFDGGLHPDVVDNFKKGVGWYRAHFPLKKELGSDRITGEASPLYIYNPVAAARIHAVVPEVKLIAVLRNPADRAISQYYHEERKQGTGEEILKRFNDEDEILGRALNEADYKSFAFLHRSYRSRGLYCQQLERYLKLFSRDQLLVVNSEVFFENPTETLRRIFSYLKIDNDFIVPDITPKNTASNSGKVSPEVSAYLREYFRPHNEALYDLIGEKFNW